MDGFENITLDDITNAGMLVDGQVEESQLGPTNSDYSDLPELEPFNLDNLTGLVNQPDDLQFARDNLAGLLNRIEHTINIGTLPSTKQPIESHEIPITCHRVRNRRKHMRPEIVNYGTIIYSSLPATQNPHVAKWLTRFTQVLETIYEHETNLDEQSHDDMLSNVLDGLNDYSTKLQNRN